jgi:ketosteroid isomerase-like protein
MGWRTLFTAVSVGTLVLASCGDDNSGEAGDTATTDGTATTSEAVVEPDDGSGDEISLEERGRARNAVVPDPVETEEVARAYCEAWNAPRDVDAMVAMMTDDVVIYDVLTGERYEGPDQAAAYIESTSAEIDTSDCGPALVGGDWVAGTYTLSSSGTSAGAEGISAVRILDGKVHWHLAFYTPTEDAQPPDDTSLRTDSTAGLRYCEAFADPAHDPDAILATMTEEPKIYGIPNGFSAEGEDAVRRMIETRVVPSDVNTCGGKGSEGPGGTLDHGGWQAGASATINEAFGLWLEGVSVMDIVDDKVARHFLQTSTFDGADEFGNLWGVTG